jgi:hypothetical protein
MARERPAQPAIGTETFADQDRIGSKVEQSSNALDDGQQRARAGEPNVEDQRRPGCSRRHRDRSLPAIDGDGARVG